jgi:hypothetical protein
MNLQALSDLGKWVMVLAKSNIRSFEKIKKSAIKYPPIYDTKAVKVYLVFSGRAD